jgi:hypothetical protein
VLHACWIYLQLLLVVLQVLLLELLLLVELLPPLLGLCVRCLGNPLLLQLVLHASVRDSQLLMQLNLRLLA